MIQPQARSVCVLSEIISAWSFVDGIQQLYGDKFLNLCVRLASLGIRFKVELDFTQFDVNVNDYTLVYDFIIVCLLGEHLKNLL